MDNSKLKKNKYDHQGVEQKWHTAWKKLSIDSVEPKEAKNPYYNLMMFPYPSAEGLHVGNMYAFTGSDVYGRYKRMSGYDVLEPIGLDGFGIHSENYALKIGRHPVDHAQITQRNYYAQLEKIGAMFDWSKTLETYDPDYYHWTQWIFIQMFKHGLAYRSKAEVNWCPKCKTVLADEQVIDGHCERCGNQVEKRLLEQWFFNITAYAEKLLGNLALLDWSNKVKITQENWIGKKTGIIITYPVLDQVGNTVGAIDCFTTRPDTNFGASFIAIAPEHPFINQIASLLDKKKLDEMRNYQIIASKKERIERTAADKEKSGIDTGLFCLHPLTQKKIPLYISDFVLMNFGTGAVVGVPGHDVRDFAFAQKYKLPIIRVVIGPDGNSEPIEKKEQVFEGEGVVTHSEFLNDMNTEHAIQAVIAHLERKSIGKAHTTYHLRDWLISRQRYWGPPIPMIYCGACAKQKKSWFTTSEGQKNTINVQHKQEAFGWYPLADDQLPLPLPHVEDYKPGDDGIAPLAKHKEFYETKCPECGEKAVRETDVSDTFLDSSWYFLRYPSIDRKKKTTAAFDAEITKKWLPVDMYTGGAEHSVLHLMYARFVTMVLHDWGLIDFEEPFKRFFAHGLVIKDGAKMSKSKGNVINPDEYIASYGADALRMYLMFMGPFSQGGDFRDTAMEGTSRWLHRIWNMSMQSIVNKPEKTDDGVLRGLAKLIHKVGEDTEKRHYNTAIAAMMEWSNGLMEKTGELAINDLKSLLLILAPYAPFMTEELWQIMHNCTELSDKKNSIHYQSWPSVDTQLLIDQTVDIIIQINGKMRDKISLSIAQANDKAFIEKSARERPQIQKYIAANTVEQVIVVPKRFINFVLSG